MGYLIIDADNAVIGYSTDEFPPGEGLMLVNAPDAVTQINFSAASVVGGVAVLDVARARSIAVLVLKKRLTGGALTAALAELDALDDWAGIMQLV